MSYTIRINACGVPRELRTAPFACYGDADRWARGYARSKTTPSRVDIVTHDGVIAATYRGDGRGEVVCDPTSMGVAAY